MDVFQLDVLDIVADVLRDEDRLALLDLRLIVPVLVVVVVVVDGDEVPNWWWWCGSSSDGLAHKDPPWLDSAELIWSRSLMLSLLEGRRDIAGDVSVEDEFLETLLVTVLPSSSTVVTLMRSLLVRPDGVQDDEEDLRLGLTRRA